MNHFKALFLVGGPGSGKDFLIHSALNEFNLKEVSMERIFNAIIKETNIEELENFPSIIVNGNADNKDKIIVTKAILESMGYDTAMIYVYTSDEASRHRNDFRIARGAKTFSESVRKTKYDSSISNLDQYIDMYEGFILYDNSNHFAVVNEERKAEMTSWLIELSETVSGFLAKNHNSSASINWISERVLEVGSADTAKFAALLTPGQASNKVHSYKEAEDKIDVGPKYNSKNKADPRDGDKFNGGVASAGNPPGNSSRVVAAEELKIIQSRKPNGGKYLKVAPMMDIASTGARASSYASGDIGVASTSGQTEQISKKTRRIPTGDNGVAQIGTGAQSITEFSGTSPIKTKKKLKIPSRRSADPEEIGGKENGAVDMPSGVGVGNSGLFEKKKLRVKDLPINSSSVDGSSLGYSGSPQGSVGATSYKEHVEKKKKLGKLPGVKVGAGLVPQDQGGAEALTTTSPSTNEAKSFEKFRNHISSTVHNFDEELKA